MGSKICLIGDQIDSQWSKVLRGAARRLDLSVEVAGVREISSKSWNDFELVVVDAGYVSDLSRTVKDIHQRKIDLHIIVLSPAPGWKEAKEALQAGATDYELRSSRGMDILHVLQRNINSLPARDPGKDVEK